MGAIVLSVISIQFDKFGLRKSSNAHGSLPTDLHIISLNYNLDVSTDQAMHCVTQHSSFSTECLQREGPQTAIVGLNQARGLRAPREINFQT